MKNVQIPALQRDCRTKVRLTSLVNGIRDLQTRQQRRQELLDQRQEILNQIEAERDGLVPNVNVNRKH